MSQKGSAEDRISDLPVDVIYVIFNYLPLQDVARTSVLSRKWRYVWAEHPQLVFDKKFSDEIIKNRSRLQFPTYFIHMVNSILSQHIGPISIFFLDLLYLSSRQFPSIGDCMSCLSRKGVKDISLVSSGCSSPYRLPSHIFSCSELIRLRLDNCIFGAPSNFQCFGNLGDLVLIRITFEKLSLSTPLLGHLALTHCSGVCNLEISAPRLELLVLVRNLDMDLTYFMTNCTSVRSAYVALNRKEHLRQDERINLTDHLGCWHRLRKLSLNDLALQYLVPGFIRRLPITFKKLTVLELININFDLDQIASILLLLQSSPSLLRLHFSASDQAVSTEMKIVEYLQKASHEDRKLQYLHTLSIHVFEGSEAELLFLKLFLGCSPSLERVLIHKKEGFNPSNVSICEEIMQLVGESSKAKVTFDETLHSF